MILYICNRFGNESKSKTKNGEHNMENEKFINDAIKCIVIGKKQIGKRDFFACIDLMHNICGYSFIEIRKHMHEWYRAEEIAKNFVDDESKYKQWLIEQKIERIKNDFN